MSKILPEYTTKLLTDIWDEASKFVTDYNNVGIPTTITDANATTLYYLLYAKYGNNPIANYDENQFKYKIYSTIFQYGPTWEKRLSVQSELRALDLADLMKNGKIEDILFHSGTTQNTSSGSSTDTKDASSTTNVDHDNTINVDDVDTNVTNHAYNPGTTPATNAFEPLNYVNEQTASKVIKDDQSVQDETTETTYTGQDVLSSTSSKSDSGSNSSEDSNTRTLTKGVIEAYAGLLELLDSDVTGDFISKFKYCFKQFVAPERPLLFVTDDAVEEEEE